MHTTNYVNAFITVAPDSTATHGTVPKQAATPSIATLTYQLISGEPYRYTSDDVLFAVYAERHAIPERDHARARAELFAKPQACLRASDLAKRYGWGIHSDARGRVAIYGVETVEYRKLAADASLAQKPAMRSRR